MRGRDASVERLGKLVGAMRENVRAIAEFADDAVVQS